MTVDAPLDMLTARLGREPDDAPRALANIWDALVEARALARQDAWEWETTPERVRVLVIRAAIRVYLNPEGYLTRQAGSFSTTKAAGTVPVGIFTDQEEQTIKSYRSRNRNGLWTLEVERPITGDDGYLTPADNREYRDAKPYAIDDTDSDWVPSLPRAIPRSVDSPYRGVF